MKKKERSIWTGGDLTEAPERGEMLGACEKTIQGVLEIRERMKDPNFFLDSGVVEPEKKSDTDGEILEPEEILEEVTEIESEPEKKPTLEIREFKEVEVLPTEVRDLLGPKMAKALLLLLKSLIESGMDVGWDNHSRHLQKKFSEVSVPKEGLSIVIGVLELSKEEECVICNFLRKTVPLMGEKDEEAVRDAILKIIFPHCCFE